MHLPFRTQLEILLDKYFPLVSIFENINSREMLFRVLYNGDNIYFNCNMVELALELDGVSEDKGRKKLRQIIDNRIKTYKYNMTENL